MTYKVFEAGETLSANDVMTYFMNQVVIQEPTFGDLAALPADVKVAYVEADDKVYAKLSGVWTPLTYNGQTATFSDLTLTGNLTVQGITTTIDSTTIAVKDKFVFEGLSANDHETTLQVTEPTIDRTITFPDATGTVALLSDIPAGYGLPSQTGNAGKFLTTNGSADSWGTLPVAYSLPSQTSNTGKFLTTDGTVESWGTVPAGFSAPTIGSTSIGSGATVTSIAGLTLTDPIITQPQSTPTFASNAYTLVAADAGKLLLASNSTTAGTVFIPTDATYAFPVGTQIIILATNTGQLTVTPTTTATTTLNSAGATANAPKIRARYSSISLFKSAANTWYAVGDLS